MSIPSSDYNQTRASMLARKRLYSDLDLNMSIHPTRKDITPLSDIHAVRNAVKNLILTNFGERPFQSKLGSNVTGLLFEPADQFTAIQMKKEIDRLLRDHEPRINMVKVQILDDVEANAYRVSIGFNVITQNTSTEVELGLQRLR
jgi:phage baseplate assembly protein W